MQIGAIFLAAILLFGLKSPDALRLPQFWAEDGSVFFVGQLHQAWPQAFQPYSGYLHFLPRMVAWFASFFPVVDSPLIYNCSAIVIDAVCVTFVTLRAGPQFGFLVVFLSFFVLPTDGEVFGTATNMQWFVQIALLTVVFLPHETPGRWPARLVFYAVLVGAALTGPVSWLIAFAVVGLFTIRFMAARIGPRLGMIDVVADKIWRDLDKMETWVVVAGAVLHIAILKLMHAGANDATGAAFRAADKTRLQALGLPEAYSPIARIMVAPTTKIHLLMAAVMLGTTVWAFYSVFKRRGQLPGGILMFFLVGLLEPVLASISHRDNYGIFLASFSTPTRYFYLLGVSSIWVLGKALLAQHHRTVRVAGLAGYGLVLVLLLALKPDYVTRSPLEDYRWDRFARQIGSGAPHVFVPVNPSGWAMLVNSEGSTP